MLEDTSIHIQTASYSVVGAVYCTDDVKTTPSPLSKTSGSTVRYSTVRESID